MSCSVCLGHSEADCPCCGTQYNVIDCPDCGGTGKGNFKVWDIIERHEVSCNQLEYMIAAEDENEAFDKSQRFCKLSCVCQRCNGEGVVMV